MGNYNVVAAKNILVLQYVLCTCSLPQQVNDALIQAGWIIQESTNGGQENGKLELGISRVLALILASVPGSFDLESRLNLGSTFLEYFIKTSQKEELSVNEVIEVGSTPEILEHALLAGDENISTAAESTLELAASLSMGFGFDITSATYKFTLSDMKRAFFAFFRAEIVKSTQSTPEISVDLDKLRQLPLYSHDLENWIINTYRPITYLAQYNEAASLTNFSSYLRPEEQISLIMEAAISYDHIPQIVSNVLVPYISSRTSMWTAFNDWLIQFGDKTIRETESSTMIENYDMILKLVRQEKLLSILSSNVSVMNKFVSIVLSIIYLCPRAVLEVFIAAKEIIAILKGLPLKSKSAMEEDSMPEPRKTVKEMAEAIDPSKEFLDSYSKIIETGQRLYANNLSLVQIANLKSSDGSVQLSELQTFIENESKYGRNSRQWQTLLSSMYWVFEKTKIFGKVDRHTLDELVLTKLLDLKYFNIVEDLFFKRYCSIPEKDTDKIVTRYAWLYYNKATNCDPSLGSLKSSVDCAKLIRNKTNESSRLQNLYLACRELLQWRISLHANTPLTPRQILDLGDILSIVTRILELNESSYKSHNKLFSLVRHIINGLQCYDRDVLFKYAKEEVLVADEINPLRVKIMVICLDFTSSVDTDYAYELSSEILDNAIENTEQTDLEKVVSDSWVSFFQFVKTEIGTPTLALLDKKLSILGKLLLVTPAEFNIPVLEYWQLLNSQRDHLLSQAEVQSSASRAESNNRGESRQQPQSFFQSSGLGDLRSRLKSSIKMSANDILKSADNGDIGRTIIGHIVGAN